MRIIYLNYIIIGLLFCGSLPLMADTEFDDFARSCLVVEAPVDRDSEEIETTVYNEKSQPGHGTRLSLFVDASVHTSVVVAVYGRNRQLANSWPPQITELRDWDEGEFPQPPVTWDWVQIGESFEIHVIFLNKDQEGIEELKTLVKTMQQPAFDKKLLQRQTKRFRTMLDALLQDKIPSYFQPGQSTRSWGGTLRSIYFPWRNHAQKIPLDEEGQGFFIYSVGSSPPSSG